MSSARIAGLQHIPGITRLEQFMQLPILVRLPSISSLVLILVLGPWWVGATFVDSVWLFVSFVMTGAVLAVIVILAKGAEEDLNRINYENAALECQKPIIELLSGLTAGVLSASYFDALFNDNALSWLRIFTTSFYSDHMLGVILSEIMINLVLLLAGLLIVYLVAYSMRQVRFFSKCSREIEIDLTHTEDLQVFALQPLRYLLITVLFVSLNIIVYQMMNQLGYGDVAFASQLPLIVGTALFGVFFLRPVFIIRDRIAKSKADELNAIRRALKGDRAALNNSQIANLADEFRAPDLLVYERFIRDVWEWPIQGYVQRILLYVLLPPLAWVLAALVEQVVDAFIS